VPEDEGVVLLEDDADAVCVRVAVPEELGVADDDAVELGVDDDEGDELGVEDADAVDVELEVELDDGVELLEAEADED
jgi:predicted  nucleic acid-binding Zn-ribbon protein